MVQTLMKSKKFVDIEFTNCISYVGSLTMYRQHLFSLITPQQPKNEIKQMIPHTINTMMGGEERFLSKNTSCWNKDTAMSTETAATAKADT